MSSHPRGQGSTSKSKPPRDKKKHRTPTPNNTNRDPFEQNRDENDSPLTPSANSYTAVPIIERGHGHIAKELINMDPFEVRIRFTQQLASLNASVTGASKTAQYALKYRDLDEDLGFVIVSDLHALRHKTSADLESP